MTPYPIIVIGSGRSGTTWLADSIAESNKLRTIFEPLNPLAIPYASTFANCYVRENDEFEDLREFMDKVISGQFNCVWTKYRYLPGILKPSICKMVSWKYNYDLLAKYKNFFLRFIKYHAKRSSPTIIKFIRANLMLGWLYKNYDAKYILLLRHPAAVVASKMKRTHQAWNFHESVQQNILKKYLCDEKLKENFLFQFDELLKKPMTDVTGHTVMWCIENVSPFLYAQQKGIHTVFYEELITNPKKEFSRIINYLGLQRMPEKSLIMRPSQQSAKEMRDKKFDKTYVSRWYSFFDDNQLGEIEKILKIFNVSLYNVNYPMPLTANANFLRSMDG